MRLSKEDAFHLNFGLPLLLTLTLSVVNIQVFANYFLEQFGLFLKLYFYATSFVLVLKVLQIKLRDLKVFGFSLFEFGVLNSIFVLTFLLLNLNYYTTIHNEKFKFNSGYLKRVEAKNVSDDFLFLYTFSELEKRDYFNRDYTLEVKVGKSFCGYKILKYRRFVK